jgi:hypothetical protein
MYIQVALEGGQRELSFSHPLPWSRGRDFGVFLFCITWVEVNSHLGHCGNWELVPAFHQWCFSLRWGLMLLIPPEL